MKKSKGTQGDTKNFTPNKAKRRPGGIDPSPSRKVFSVYRSQSKGA